MTKSKPNFRIPTFWNILQNEKGWVIIDIIFEFIFSNQLIDTTGKRPYKTGAGPYKDNTVPAFIRKFKNQWGIFILQFFAPIFIEYVSRCILLHDHLQLYSDDSPSEKLTLISNNLQNSPGFFRGEFQETLQKIYWSGQAFRLTKRELFSLFLRDTS